MAKALIVYGSTTGDTAIVARKLSQLLGDVADGPRHVASMEPEELLAADVLILGCPTWDMGDLPGDWKSIFPDLDHLDFSGKLVALFGLGDQTSFPDHFVDALGILFHKLRERGATFVGAWPTEGYEFDRSTAVVDGQFVGLAIDQMNQWRQTSGRLQQWVDLILPIIRERLAA